MINQDVDKKDCLILQKAIYGLVQAARQGFQLSKADPCILYKEDEKGFVSS